MRNISSKSGKWKQIFIFLVTIYGFFVCGGNIKLDHVSIRQDIYPLKASEWQWGEAWGEQRQYFPRYFKPSGTIHLFFQNKSEKSLTIESLKFNGKPIEEVTTRQDFAGDIIWHRINPEKIKPNGYGMIYLRLRKLPKKTINISLSTSLGEKLDVQVAPILQQKVRLSYVGFSKNIDKLYVYIDKVANIQATVNKIFIDGKELTQNSSIFNADFSAGPALIEVSLKKTFSYGSYHIVRVETAQGDVAIHQVRARSSRFYTGIIGGNFKEYYAKFFNFIYRMHGSFPKKLNWWKEDSKYAKLGFTLLQPTPSAEAIKAGTTVPPGRIVYGNIDEPDAHEPRGLPYMQRCGINIMKRVEPVMKLQRAGDPHHETALLIDRTYAPMNWLTYGEVPDIVFNDIYAPTQWGGYDLTVFTHSMKPLLSGTSPRPVNIMLWGGMNTGYPMKRSLTPEENAISAHYVVGGGAKGLHYFLDWNSYPTKLEGGYFIGAPRTNMQWKNIGRVNAKFTRIGNLLAIGNPFPVAQTDDSGLWVGSLLCGKDNILIFLVNRNHRINVEDRITKQPHIFPVENAMVNIKLPSWFKDVSALEIKHDGTPAVKLAGKGQKRSIQVRNLRTAKVILISRNKNIADSLKLDPAQYQAFLESEKPKFVTNSAPIKQLNQPESVIKVTDKQLKQGKIILDLTDPAILKKAVEIKVDGGVMKLKPAKWLGLFTPKGWHAQSDITFAIQCEIPLKKIKAKLYSQTPNFAACANNTIEISNDDKRYAKDCSLKTDWNGGAYRGECLSQQLKISEKKGLKTFFIRVVMKDPGIVYSDQATNILKKVIVTFKPEKK